MITRILQWFRLHYYNILNSIAFFPALIAIGFLLLSYVALEIDFSDYGKSLKARWDIISLKDASTARSIAATVVGGILSLAVFSFSMVMILLNQAASNMSNRVLDSMIGNRFQQVVLGFYIGTIVYALALLSTIRDIQSGIYIPALSIYLLMFLTIVDIFLFIYFLHYITQSVKYEIIIERLHRKTKSALEDTKEISPESPEEAYVKISGKAIKTERSDYFQGFNQKALLHLCEINDWVVSFPHPAGSYLLTGTTYAIIQSKDEVTPDQVKDLKVQVDLHRGHPITRNPYYGFEQLVEVALKALSPGINDPETAVLSLHALTDLLAFQLVHRPDPVIRDSNGKPRILVSLPSFEKLFESCFLPIWDYGKEDRMMRVELILMLEQLYGVVSSAEHQLLITKLLDQVKKAVKQNTLNSLSYSKPD
ncbi:DUF2254 domain-containing protein [Telluribacter humicola]|uniref:DUF2254 domain-containing protein n=1 Tax=Telluribacter humicola TaxID=1720261 RepID=UPI001A966C63|nr:DUF2254 domain-containing protein [Telluribacter humicola]